MVCLSNTIICVYEVLSRKLSEKTLRMYISFHSLLIFSSVWLVVVKVTYFCLAEHLDRATET